MKLRSRCKFNGRIWTLASYAPDKRYAQAMIRGNTPADPREFVGYYTKIIKNPHSTREGDAWLIYKRSRKRAKKS